MWVESGKQGWKGRLFIRLCNCGYCDKSLSELGSGTNQLNVAPWHGGGGRGENQRGYIIKPLGKGVCAVSTAAMGLNALFEGVGSPKSGVLLSVDKSFSLTVSPVTAQITGLNEAVGFSDRFGEACAGAGWASYPLPPSGRPLLFRGLASRRS